MGKIDLGGNNEIIQPVKKTGISEGVKDYKNIMEKTKKRVEILKFLDELEIPEDKQDKYLKEILKYNIFDKIQEAFDENDLRKIIDKEKKSEEKEKIEYLKYDKKEKIYKLNSLKNSRKEENQEVKEENQEVKEENQEVKEENQEVKEENQEVKEENQEINNYKKIITFLSNSKQLDGNNSKYGNILKNLIHKYKENKNNFEITDIKEELEKLSQPDIFVAFANDLGGPNSIEYKHFKSLVKNTSSWNDFEGLFRDYESLDGTIISADKVIEGIEKDSGGLVDINLGKNPPVSTLRLMGSQYGFDKEIDKVSLAKITKESEFELNEIKKNGFDVINDFNQNFMKENFDIGKMQDMYDYFDIKDNEQIKINDLEDFRNAENPKEKQKIYDEKIKPKIEKIVEIIGKKQAGILKVYEKQIKEAILRENKRKAEQLKTLKFLHNIGFDLIPKDLTDKVIYQINNSSGLKGAIDLGGGNTFAEKIDLQNGELGFTSGTNHQELFTRFFNKMISGSPTEPINVNDILNGTGVGVKDRTKFLNELNKVILKNPGAFSGKALENLKKPIKSQSQEQKEK